MRRAYHADGRSAPLWLVRALLIPATPLLILYGVVLVLGKNIAGAFYYAWLEARIGWSETKRMWGGEL